jgi:hypothetical protein
LLAYRCEQPPIEQPPDLPDTSFHPPAPVAVPDEIAHPPPSVAFSPAAFAAAFGTIPPPSSWSSSGQSPQSPTLASDPIPSPTARLFLALCFSLSRGRSLIGFPAGGL